MHIIFNASTCTCFKPVSQVACLCQEKCGSWLRHCRSHSYMHTREKGGSIVASAMPKPCIAEATNHIWLRHCRSPDRENKSTISSSSSRICDHAIVYLHHAKYNRLYAKYRCVDYIIYTYVFHIIDTPAMLVDLFSLKKTTVKGTCMLSTLCMSTPMSPPGAKTSPLRRPN